MSIASAPPRPDVRIQRADHARHGVEAGTGPSQIVYSISRRGAPLSTNEQRDAFEEQHGQSVDAVWAGAVGTLKLSLVIASLALGIAEVARAAQGKGVSLPGALGLYLQVTAVSALLAGALRFMWRALPGAMLAAWLAAAGPSLLTLWLLERADLRASAGGVTLLAHGVVLSALLALPIGILLWRRATRDTP